jgi:excisionase family DNA binding protein
MRMLGLRCHVVDVRDSRRDLGTRTTGALLIMSIADQIEKIGRALTAEELAKLLSVSKVTIFKQAAAGRIPSFRVGTCVRFDPRAVANWLRSM